MTSRAGVTSSTTLRSPDRTLRPGYLAEEGASLTLTPQGEQQIGRLVEARRRWLARELIDWGADDDALLSQALDNLARRLVSESADLEPVSRSLSPA